MKALLPLLPELIRAIGSLIRAARQPDITYERTHHRRRWIAKYKGWVYEADTRPEAAAGVLRRAAKYGAR